MDPEILPLFILMYEWAIVLQTGEYVKEEQDEKVMRIPYFMSLACFLPPGIFDMEQHVSVSRC